MTWYWHPAHEAAETSLQTLAFNIQTLGGRLRMAGRRGENVLVPFREGRLWVPKVYEETELTLAMWVVGAEEDGGIPASPSDQFWTNVEKLKRLFTTDRELGILSYNHPTLAARVYGEAEITDAIDFETDAGATRAAFVVDFTLPKVWFRPSAFGGDASSIGRTNTEQWSINVPSDVRIKDPVITLTHPGSPAGSVANVRLYNESLSASDHWLEYQDIIDDGDTVVIDVGAWTAVLNGTTNVGNNLDWSGQPEFFELQQGQNNLKVEFTGGSSIEVQVQAKGRYW